MRTLEACVPRPLLIDLCSDDRGAAGQSYGSVQGPVVLASSASAPPPPASGSPALPAPSQAASMLSGESPQPQPQIVPKVMKRSTSKPDDLGKRTVDTGKLIASSEEKELMYAAARAKIFGATESPDPSAASATQSSNGYGEIVAIDAVAEAPIRTQTPPLPPRAAPASAAASSGSTTGAGTAVAAAASTTTTSAKKKQQTAAAQVESAGEVPERLVGYKQHKQTVDVTKWKDRRSQTRNKQEEKNDPDFARASAYSAPQTPYGQAPYGSPMPPGAAPYYSPSPYGPGYNQQPHMGRYAPQQQPYYVPSAPLPMQYPGAPPPPTDLSHFPVLGGSAPSPPVGRPGRQSSPTINRGPSAGQGYPIAPGLGYGPYSPQQPVPHYPPSPPRP